MSELKEIELGEAYKVFDDDKEFYLKSEADKVIAEKDAQILDLIERVQKERAAKVDYKISANDLNDGLKKAYEEIDHHKYKRCLAMARWCASRSASWCLDPADEQLHKSDFYDKWKKRWLELAEKFKPNNLTPRRNDG